MASEMDQDVEIVVVDVGTVAGGYRVSELMRSTVVNDRGERIGTIDDFIIGGDDRVLFAVLQVGGFLGLGGRDRKSTRLNSSHQIISYAVFCLKKKKQERHAPLM